MSNQSVEICAIIKKETPAAILIYDRTNEVWLPKSQIEMDDNNSKDDTVVITMPEWLANQKGFI